MKISNLNAGKAGPTARLSATVEWEETERAPVELFFEMPSDCAAADAYASGNANAFLVAAVLPAMEAGERRVAIDGVICPRLRAGLLAILEMFRYWYGGEGPILAIEGTLQDGHDARRTPDRAGCFFTGGIDSLATLRRNQLMFPKTHPEYVKDAVLLYGINFDSDDSPDTFARAVGELSMVTDAADVHLIPIQTNMRRVLNPDVMFFTDKYHAALLGATAHALNARLTTMSIASTHDMPNLMPWGSHPLVDPNFSSFDMRIYHDGLDLSRFAKTRLIADWEVGLANIKVCGSNWPGINCSRCEKCLRTMLALVALGALKRSAAFAPDDVTEETVRGIQLSTENQQSYFGELIEPLRAAGRPDLARGVEFILTRYRGEVGVRGQLKRLDRLYFGGGLRTLKTRLRDGMPAHVPVRT